MSDISTMSSISSAAELSSSTVPCYADSSNVFLEFALSAHRTPTEAEIKGTGRMTEVECGMGRSIKTKFVRKRELHSPGAQPVLLSWVNNLLQRTESGFNTECLQQDTPVSTVPKSTTFNATVSTVPGKHHVTRLFQYHPRHELRERVPFLPRFAP